MSEARSPLFDELVVEPAELEAFLGDPRLLVVDLRNLEHYAAGHVPGAVNAAYADLVAVRPPAMGVLPDTDQLSRVLGQLGLQDDRHVVAYDDEGGGRASRLLWTLDALGHPAMSLLNGGIHAWANEGHRLSTDSLEIEPGSYLARVRNPRVIADREEVLASLDNSDTVLLDARSRREYLGRDVRAARGGHIPGAVHFNWTDSMDPHHNLRLLPADTLVSRLASLGVTCDRQVIVYCQTHHRSAHTYITLKHLGFARLSGYAGAWSEWGNDPRLPVEI